MANPGHLIKTFKASGAVGRRRLVKFAATEGRVEVATSGADLIVGASDSGVDAADGQNVDVNMDGSTEVVAGAAIAQGASVTAFTAGVAVTAATGNIAVGYALQPALAAGDVIDIALSRHTAA